jgi:hypothetical protein
MAELNTLAPKKWPADYGGNAPTIDITDGVSIGDFAIETGATNTNAIWRCRDNTDAAAVWQLQSGTYYDIVVDLEGSGDTTSIAAAITLANTRSPAVDNPINITIKAGVYQEAAMTVPSYVSITAEPRAVYVEPTVNTQTTFTLSSNSAMNYINCQGNDGSGGVAFKTASGATGVVIYNCQARDCETGYWAIGSGANLSIYSSTAVKAPTQTMTTAYYATGGARMNAVGCTAIGTSASIITNGFYATGTGTTLTSEAMTAYECTNGVYSDDSASIEVVAGLVEDCVNALRCGSTGSPTLHSYSVDIEDPDTYSIYLESATSSFRHIGGTFNASKVSIAAGATAQLNSYSTFENDEGMVNWGQMEVGRIGDGKEFRAGEGGSTVIGMSVLTNTNGEAGSWTDETADTSSPSGSTFTFFPGTGAENCIYIGNDFEFCGVRITNISTAMVYGTGAVVAEYWNGSTWTAFNIMETQADAPYSSRAQFALLNTGSVQIRWAPFSDWATKSLNGTTKYWARYRITSAITTAPVAEQFKCSTNRAEINKDGFLEFFGAGEPVKTLPTDFVLRDLSGFAASNNNVNVGTNTNVVGNNNNRAGTAKDGSGGVLEIPEGLDTSRPVTMRVRWAVSGTGTGDVEIEGALAPFTTGDTLDGTITEITDADITTITSANDNGVVIESDLTFDIPGALPEDSVAFSVFRDATAGNTDDTLSNAIYITRVTIEGYFWR